MSNYLAGGDKVENSDNIFKILGIESDSVVYSLVDSSIEAIPIIGKIHNAYKMRRLQKRVSQHEEKLKQLSITMHENGNKLLDEFIRQKAFPIVLDEMLSEHEEEKIDLVINGLEYTYKEEITEVSKLLVYFDVLRELRVEELKKLLTHSEHYKRHWEPTLKMSLVHPDDREGIKKQREVQGLKAYIDNHLATLGLTTTKEITEEYGLETISREIVLTEFGEHFIDFFDLTVWSQIPAD